MTKAEMQAKAEMERRRRELASGSFKNFIRKVMPAYQLYPHTERFCSALQRVADGESDRLMVFCPPRHGKSLTVSRLFPAYHLLRFPERFVGLNSYSAELAYSLSREARAYYTGAGGKMRADATAVKNWRVEGGGGLWAAGVGGSITGKGFHLGIIDDPLKNAEEAASGKIRQKQKDWYDSTFYTREEPGGAIVVVQTRWHEDDLSGYLLSEEKEAAERLEAGESAEPEGWEVLNFEAVKGEEPLEVPSTATLVPDWRSAGEALCPPRFSASKLSSIRGNIAAKFWASLYQQRPSPPGGDVWKREWFDGQTFTGRPDGLRGVGYDWDTAYTSNEKNSATAFVKSGRDGDGNVYILDCGFRWVETPAAEEWMASLGGPHFIEGKASGKSLVQQLKARNISAKETDVPGRAHDKEERASLVTPRASTGDVYVAEHILPLLLEDERQGILKFPSSSHDDLNDALVQAIARHSTGTIDLDGLHIPL